MWSKPAVFSLPTLEDAFRGVLLLVDVVGISLAFIGLRAAYIVLGVIFAISIIFNVTVVLGQSHTTRKMLKNGQPVCPFLPALALETVGALSFLILYIIATIDTVDHSYYYGYYDVSMTYVHAYAGMSGLVAFVLHGALAIMRISQMLHFHRSLETPCPHCHRGSGYTYSQPPSQQISPLVLESQGPARPDKRSVANVEGEAESDSLIMKE